MKDKIDMVYLWCDGNEPEFAMRKKEFLKYLGPNTIKNEEVVGDKRFIDNDELKYSLRSLEKYASWINHVYIVTDRQVPKWLNINYDKVRIVDHSEIMPKEIIPCFNSTVLEWYLPFIPNLSEKFLYGNDDMFFGNFVKPEDFFVGDKAIVHVSKMKNSKIEDGDVYKQILLNAIKLVEEKYQIGYFYEPHHNIDAYNRTMFLETIKRFRSSFKKFYLNRFRKPEDVQRIIFSLDAVHNKKAILNIIQNPTGFERNVLYLFKHIKWDSFYANEGDLKSYKRIIRFKPKLFCINAGNDNSVEAKLETRKFMESLFPEKSKFEI